VLLAVALREPGLADEIGDLHVPGDADDTALLQEIGGQAGEPLRDRFHDSSVRSLLGGDLTSIVQNTKAAKQTLVARGPARSSPVVRQAAPAAVRRGAAHQENTRSTGIAQSRRSH
jgi:hypothetical protein